MNKNSFFKIKRLAAGIIGFMMLVFAVFSADTLWFPGKSGSTINLLRFFDVIYSFNMKTEVFT